MSLLLRPVDCATLVISGGDRQRWFNGMVTADLNSLKVSGVLFGLIVQKTGKLRAEVLIASAPDQLLISLPDALADEIAAELDRYLVMDDAELRVSRGEYVWCSAFGLERGPSETALLEAGAAAAAWVKRGGAHALTCVAATAQQPAVEAVLQQTFKAEAAAEAAWQTFRVGAFIPERGVDFDEAYPQEAALELDAVSFQKGCYLGQEAVFMLQHRGHVKKRLVQLALQGAAKVGDVVQNAEGVEVGHVTSMGAGVGLAMVKYKSAFAGSELRVGGNPAKVTSLLSLVPEAGA
jgi:folate-binding protein YgfZ